MTTYAPDRWVILAVTTPDGSLLHKVFATWHGCYTTGDEWKLNSGNVSVTKDIYWYLVKGYSGSIYELHKKCYGLSVYTCGVLHNMLEKSGGIVKLLSEEESLEYLEGMTK